jgi:hypothetical protein
LSDNGLFALSEGPRHVAAADFGFQGGRIG